MSKSSAFGFGTRRQRVEIALKPHRVWWVQALLIVWRWSFEIAAAIGVVLAYQHLRHGLPAWGALAVMAAPVVIALAVPWTRRQVLGWFWAAITRHRLRAFFTAARMTNGHGKLPWLLLVRPTAVGERALCFLVAGMAVTDLADRGQAIAATCWASDARIARSTRLAALVWIDVIRRDPLAATKPLDSELLPKTARRNAGPTGTAGDTPAPARPFTRLADSISNRPARATAPGNPNPSRPATPEPRIPAQQDAPHVVRHGEDLSDYV